MADELPEVGAFNQQPTLADVGKSSAATSLGSIGSLINLLTAKNTTDNMPEYMSILSPDFETSGTDLPDIEYFKEVFGAPESLNIGDFVSIDPFSKVLATGKGIMAAGKGIMAMVPYITASGVNVTKRLETIRKIKDRAISTRNAARSSENPKLKEAEYRDADKLDLEAKKLESQITPEDIINEQKHRAAQSTKEGAEKGLADVRKSLGIDPERKPLNDFKSVSDNPSKLYDDILQKLKTDNPNQLPELTKNIMKSKAYTNNGIKIIANSGQITPKEATHLRKLLKQHSTKKIGRDSGENVYEYRGYELFNPKGYGERSQYQIINNKGELIDSSDDMANAKNLIDKMIDEIQ